MRALPFQGSDQSFDLLAVGAAQGGEDLGEDACRSPPINADGVWMNAEGVVGVECQVEWTTIELENSHADQHLLSLHRLACVVADPGEDVGQFLGPAHLVCLHRSNLQGSRWHGG